MLQHSHRTVPFTKKVHNLVVLCDGLQSPANIGAIFRLCDAFGVTELIFNEAPDLSSNRLKRTARNTEKNVTFRVSDNFVETLHIFTDRGYHSVALEITAQSVPLHSITDLKLNKIALVIGSENKGVSEELLQVVQNAAHIEMFGKNSSMNVAQATAIALYELTKH